MVGILLLSGQELHIGAHVHLAVLNVTVRRLNKAHGVHASVYAQRRNQTDVRPFRRFDGAKTSVVRVVNVTYFEAGTLARQTSWPECRYATLVRHLGQRVGLVHELRQLVRTEERVDYAGQCPSINQVHRLEVLIVAHVHALLDGTRHTGQAHAELGVKLLAHGAHPTVAQVVNVVDNSLRITQANQVLHNQHNVLVGQYPRLLVHANLKLLVNPVAAYFPEVVALVREKQLLDNVTGSFFVRSLRVPELTVNLLHGFFLRIGVILLQRVIDNCEVRNVHVFTVHYNRLGASLQNHVNIGFLNRGITLQQHFVAVNRHHFAGVFVHEVFRPSAQHPSS